MSPCSVKVFWPGIEMGPPSISINDGLGFLPDFPSGAVRPQYLQFRSLQLNGKPANVIPGTVSIAGQKRVTIDCEYRISQISVFDEAGISELSGLTLCESGSWAAQGQDLPFQDAEGQVRGPIGTNLFSPITLQDKSGTHIYFVSAPGYAWSKVPVDHETPGGYRVRLRRGGRASVTYPSRYTRLDLAA